ncbi:hypothetical protein BC826DRAFT_973093 [Russula brevipes]|nr:hypothetical protein BC826DRAFT_973093 [Russula brevipes]
MATVWKFPCAADSGRKSFALGQCVTTQDREVRSEPRKASTLRQFLWAGVMTRLLPYLDSHPLVVLNVPVTAPSCGAIGANDDWRKGQGLKSGPAHPEPSRLRAALLSFRSGRASRHVGPAWTKTGNRSPLFALRPGPIRFPCENAPYPAPTASAIGCRQRDSSRGPRGAGYGHPPPRRPAKASSDSPCSLASEISSQLC